MPKGEDAKPTPKRKREHPRGQRRQPAMLPQPISNNTPRPNVNPPHVVDASPAQKFEPGSEGTGSQTPIGPAAPGTVDRSIPVDRLEPGSPDKDVVVPAESVFRGILRMREGRVYIESGGISAEVL